MKTLQEVIHYEMASCTLFGSILYRISTSYFIWVCERKLRRYNHHEAQRKINQTLKRGMPQGANI